jgi:hypothetical protein
LAQDHQNFRHRQPARKQPLGLKPGGFGTGHFDEREKDRMTTLEGILNRLQGCLDDLAPDAREGPACILGELLGVFACMQNEIQDLRSRLAAAEEAGEMMTRAVFEQEQEIIFLADRLTRLQNQALFTEN